MHAYQRSQHLGVSPSKPGRRLESELEVETFLVKKAEASRTTIWHIAHYFVDMPWLFPLLSRCLHPCSPESLGHFVDQLASLQVADILSEIN